MEEEEEGVTLCIRLIRSFEYRNIRVITMRNVSLDNTVKELMSLVDAEVQTSSLPPPFKKSSFDCMKINFQAHGSKTSDTAITTDHDEWILSLEARLRDCGIRNETELSYFKRTEYEKYKKNPQLLW